jgi:serine phosphatase RsbU (regulator of sigma subunit)
VATIDPRTGAVEVAGGGHPPPLHVRQGGSAAWVEAPGRGVGTPDPGSIQLGHTVLDPGDSLVVYTDGVVESDRDLVRGLATLRSAAVALRRAPADGWSRRLMDAVLPAAPTGDDAVVLLVRRLPDGAAAPLGH